ncbi:DUF6491 family protein [Gilvimarinus sp. F26214L]|uniref:DUF6491 family protein n=1 Tax=Gilvimarinus sp. DZF01 TaxID=3461371 RepID=UPI00404520CB
MRDKTVMVTLLLILSAALVSCAQTPPNEESVERTLTDMNLTEDRTVDSIRDYRIDGWRYVDRYHVILTGRGKENYLVSFLTPCLDLQGAFSIGFTSTAGGVTRFDDIVVRGPGGRAEVCPIKEIIRLRDSEQ